MRIAPQHEEHPARIVMFDVMQDFITELSGKEYDLEKGLGGTEPGQRFVFDFRTCSPNVGEAMEIGNWKGLDGEQPSAEVMLNNFIVSGRMEGGIYLVVVPFRRW